MSVVLGSGKYTVRQMTNIQIMQEITNTTNSPHVNPVVRVLIADDHPHVVKMLKRMLSRMELPLEIQTASSATEAVEQITKNPVRLLITDFRMPDMSGLDLIKRLDDDVMPEHIILITAYDSPGLKLAAQDLGVDDYVVKPFDPKDFRDVVLLAVKALQGTNLKPN